MTLLEENGSIDIIDTHVHLDAEQFRSDLNDVIAGAVKVGVTRMITIGSGFGSQSSENAIAIAEAYPESVWCTVGVHPLDASMPLTDEVLELLERNAAHPKVVAIGEAGIDLHWKRDPIAIQEKWFITQIELAKRLNKPLIIHSREAGERCLELLINHGADQVGGVFHCFAEDEKFAERLRDINFLVSFTGVITFKKSDEVRRIASKIPLSQIMVETDAPFMSPEPNRGKRCEPAYTRYTAGCLASIHGITLEEIAATTSKNAETLFSLPPKRGS